VSPVRRLLVANRGEIARRIFRTCRQEGIATVAVYSEPDRGAAFVKEADLAVALGGASASETYLDVRKILDAARRSGADAVHPGYGFLAENAAFARACREAGLVFIGPPVEAIAAMGSKVEAKRRMAAASVPVIQSAEIAEGDLRSAAERVGYPLLVKASAGGGGRGMRLVRAAGDLAGAVASARREAASAFGDGTVFLERFLEGARHIELQVFADSHGHVVHLLERECSIQRRHQKIVEECPSVVLEANPTLRRAMGEAACAAAAAIGYLGAGTVEFLVTAAGDFYFLEMNTRLQVEHPVTECVLGLDLVRLQILVAEGAPLPEAALHPLARGHAIEARLYAEDPEREFLPATGRIHRFAVPALAGVRVDSGVEDGSLVSMHYDPLLAKIVAHGETRDEAARRLTAALAGMRLHGVVNNRNLLLGVLRHPEFLAGKTDVAFLERNEPNALAAPPAGREGEGLHAAAAALASAAQRRQTAPVLGFAPSGWRNNPSQLQQACFLAPSGRIEVGYRWDREGVTLRVDGKGFTAVRVGACGPEAVELELDGILRRFDVHRVADVVYVDSVLGATALEQLPRFPLAGDEVAAGSLRAPMPGVVVRLAAESGQQIEAGALVAVVEAMKMEHAVKAPRSGRVSEVRVKIGQTVEAGFVLAVIEEVEAS
jgi:acetyl/propionyl-CoA carboxylase alpha subunit